MHLYHLWWSWDNTRRIDISNGWKGDKNMEIDHEHFHLQMAKVNIWHISVKHSRSDLKKPRTQQLSRQNSNIVTKMTTDPNTGATTLIKRCNKWWIYGELTIIRTLRQHNINWELNEYHSLSPTGDTLTCTNTRKDLLPSKDIVKDVIVPNTLILTGFDVGKKPYWISIRL